MAKLYDTEIVLRSSSEKDLNKMRCDLYRIGANAPYGGEFSLSGKSFAEFYFPGDYRTFSNVSKRVIGGFTDVFPCEGGYSFKMKTQDEKEPAVAMWKAIVDRYYPETEFFYRSDPNVPIAERMAPGYADTRDEKDFYKYDPENILDAPKGATEKDPDDYILVDKPLSETNTGEMRLADIERQMRKFNRGMSR